MTVPFALTAGLSSLGSSRLVYVAGVAELVSGALSMGVGGFLSAQAERDHYRYSKRTTRERVERSCAGEMEREVAAILSPLGIDDSISRRVAGSLLQTEASLPLPIQGPSAFKQFLHKISRGPKFSTIGTESERLIPVQSDEDEDDKGLTAFLLKFGEGIEEVSDARLFISAFTIGGSCKYSITFSHSSPFSSLTFTLFLLNRRTRRFSTTTTLLLSRNSIRRSLHFNSYHYHRFISIWRIQNVLYWGRGGNQRLFIWMYFYVSSRRFSCCCFFWYC